MKIGRCDIKVVLLQLLCKMAAGEEDCLHSLLECADLSNKEKIFIDKGITKIEHFLGADYQFLIDSVQLKPVQAKPLIRTLNEKHGIKIDIQPQSQTEQSSSLKSKFKQAIITSDASAVKRMKIDLPTDVESPVLGLKGWGKYLYPHPKTPRMLFYNELIPVLYDASYGVVPNFEEYLHDQISFRWECKVANEKSEKQILFLEGTGSGANRFFGFKGTPKAHDKKTLEKLVSDVIDYQDDVEKQKPYLSNRRKAYIGDGPSGVKHGFDDDFSFINLTITKSDELLTKFSSILSKLNDTMALFKRTKTPQQKSCQQSKKDQQKKMQERLRNREMK